MGSSHEMVKNVHISFLSCVIIGRTLYMACMPLPQWPNGGGEGVRVGGGVHDSYTFQCGLVGSFTPPGIDTR